MLTISQTTKQYTKMAACDEYSFPVTAAIITSGQLYTGGKMLVCELHFDQSELVLHLFFIHVLLFLMHIMVDNHGSSMLMYPAKVDHFAGMWLLETCFLKYN